MFKLALALGKDIREIEAWPSPLISEWMAYDQIEPIPDSWYQAGIIASTMVNLWSKSKMAPTEFIPRVRTRRQSVEEQLMIFRGIAARQAAQVASHSNKRG